MAAEAAGAGDTAEAATVEETGAAEEATGRAGADTAATGEAGEGGTHLGEMQQLQRHRQDPVHRVPEAGVQVPRERHLQRGVQVLQEPLRGVLLASEET